MEKDNSVILDVTLRPVIHKGNCGMRWVEHAKFAMNTINNRRMAWQ